METFLQWVGGKRWLSHNLSKLIQKHLTGCYYEPFIGSGAVFFNLEPKQSHIADTLESLTATYNEIKTDAIKVWSFLNSISKETNSKNQYDLYKSRFNSLLSHGKYDEEFAALFIYLNRSGFNGLWRQNSNGEFNVAYGNHTKLKLPSFGHLLEASRILSNTTIQTITSSNDTISIINKSEYGDVVYADPPYLHTYQGYDEMIDVGKDFQEELAISLWQAARRGVAVFITNNDCPETRKWYGAFATIKTYNRSQSIAGTNEGRKRWNQILAIATP